VPDAGQLADLHVTDLVDEALTVQGGRQHSVVLWPSDQRRHRDGGESAQHGLAGGHGLGHRVDDRAVDGRAPSARPAQRSSVPHGASLCAVGIGAAAPASRHGPSARSIAGCGRSSGETARPDVGPAGPLAASRTRCDRNDAAGATTRRELEGQARAHRVTDDVRLGHPVGVEFGLSPFRQPVEVELRRRRTPSLRYPRTRRTAPRRLRRSRTSEMGRMAQQGTPRIRLRGKPRRPDRPGRLLSRFRLCQRPRIESGTFSRDSVSGPQACGWRPASSGLPTATSRSNSILTISSFTTTFLTANQLHREPGPFHLFPFIGGEYSVTHLAQRRRSSSV